MDKALFRAYVKELVKEQIEDSVEKAVRKILPEVLSEAVAEIKGSTRSVNESTTPKQPIDRSRLAQLMGVTREGDTITASTNNMISPMVRIPNNLPPDDPAVIAVTRDYREVMKKMGLSK